MNSTRAIKVSEGRTVHIGEFKMVLHQSVPTSSVVWVKYKKGAVARVFVEVYP